jgi:hypothetical protein
MFTPSMHKNVGAMSGRRQSHQAACTMNSIISHQAGPHHLNTACSQLSHISNQSVPPKNVPDTGYNPYNSAPCRKPSPGSSFGFSHGKSGRRNETGQISLSSQSRTSGTSKYQQTSPNYPISKQPPNAANGAVCGGVSHSTTSRKQQVYMCKGPSTKTTSREERWELKRQLHQQRLSSRPQRMKWERPEEIYVKHSHDSERLVLRSSNGKSRVSDTPF